MGDSDPGDLSWAVGTAHGACGSFFPACSVLRCRVNSEENVQKAEYSLLPVSVGGVFDECAAVRNGRE